MNNPKLKSALSPLIRLMPSARNARRKLLSGTNAAAEVCEPRLLMSAAETEVPTNSPTEETIAADAVAAADETVQADAEASAEQTAETVHEQFDVQELDETHQFHQTGNLWENWGGQNEKWFQDHDRAWYFITADGEIRRWHGGDITNSTSVGFVDPECYQDISVLTAADDANVVPAEDNVMELENGDILFWTSETAGQVVSTDGTVTEYSDIVIHEESATGPIQDSHTLGSIAGTTQAVTGDRVNATAEDLRDEFNLTEVFEQWDDWGGKDTKWFRDDKGVWYFLTASGHLHRWTTPNEAEGICVANVDPSIFEDPNILLEIESYS